MWLHVGIASSGSREEGDGDGRKGYDRGGTL